ncbi:type II secretion system F family protein [Limosilactobacillus frumenti]|uniref:type II secretion system F family protein n=1 Tax=Limosilactobacillus frumenti TaxID=104955 RepID=UPI00070F7E30|nr:type II secretion system F family protein [Limosilactobacillus frumenti]MBA2914522.1 hypothetical protein [Limosilactobacillus frumenti]QFG72364.1 hypothetical protein LF145_02885 [Limosilactobacillus frumenti]
MIGKKNLRNFKRKNKLGGKRLSDSGKGKFNARHQASWFIFLGKLIQSGFALQHAVCFTIEDIYTAWPELKSVPQKMANGKTFAEAIKPIVKPTLYHQLLLAEQHGDLDDCLLKVGKMMELREKQRQKLWGILMYPLLLAGLLMVMFVLLRLFVLPELSQWSADDQLPSFMHLLTTSGWTIIGITLIYLLGMMIRFLRANRVQRASILASLPLLGKSFQSYYGYYLTVHLTMLLESGLSLREICDVLVDSEADTLMTDIAKEYQPLLEDGQPIENLLERHHFIPKEVALVLKKGSMMTKEIQDLNALSKVLFERFSTSVERLLVLIPPILFSILAVVIISMYLSLLWPIYQSMQGVLQ